MEDRAILELCYKVDLSLLYRREGVIKDFYSLFTCKEVNKLFGYSLEDVP